MATVITVRQVESLLQGHFRHTTVHIGSAEYRIEKFHPGGIVHTWYAFGGRQDFIELFITNLETHYREESVKNRVLDQHWIQYALEEVKENDSLERLTRATLTDPDGEPEGASVRFVVAMLRAGNPEDDRRSVGLASLVNQPCLSAYRDSAHEIAQDLEAQGIIAREPRAAGYRLRVLFPRFSQDWWHQDQLDW